VTSQPFTDTLPGADSPESGESSGERQSGRRRNRRGGRGRDRDEATATGSDTALQPSAPGEQADLAVAAGAGGVDSTPGNELNGAEATRAENAEGGDGRRRGRGRDRNRRERPADSVAGNSGEMDGLIQGGALAAGAFHDAETPIAPPTPLERVSSTPGLADSPDVARAAFAQPTQAFATPQPPAVTQEVMTALPVPAQAPVVQAAAVAEPFVLPMDTLQAVAQSAGLQWVNSDAEKIRAVQLAMASEPPVVHVPRERAPLAVIDEGPLVLVETRKDLSEFKLPFDNAQAGSPPRV
jgi:ribonuclease E